MTKLKTEPLGLKLRLIFLTALLSGCAGLKKFPTDRLWEFDSKNQVCGEYQITDFEHFKFKHLRDVPLKQCPEVFGFTAKDIPKVLNWSEDAVEYAKKRCQ